MKKQSNSTEADSAAQRVLKGETVSQGRREATSKQGVKRSHHLRTGQAGTSPGPTEKGDCLLTEKHRSSLQ